MSESAAPTLEAVAARVRACELCPLHHGRTNAVPGEGTAKVGILLVGEAPGRNEDETGRPFCGAAGKNLDLAFDAAGIRRADCFVTSIVKCRPPDNRDPTPGEKEACHPYLRDQIRLLKPRVIVALGRHALSALVPDVGGSFTDHQAKFLKGRDGVPVWVSLHPAAVIYRQAWKQQYLADWRAFGAWIRSGKPATDGRLGG